MDSEDIKAIMALTYGEGPLGAVRPGVRPYKRDGIGRQLKLWTKYEFVQILHKQQLPIERPLHIWPKLTD